MFYDSAGTVEFYRTFGQGEIAHLSTRTDLPSTWTHILAGKFSPSDYSGLLTYDSAGTGEFWRTDGAGGMTRLSRHTDWRSTWTHIIAARFSFGDYSDLLFYDSAGTVEVWKTDGQGGMTRLSTHRLEGHWKQILPVRVDVPTSGGWASVYGLLLYDDVGTLEFHTYDEQGGFSLLSQYTGWHPSGKIINISA
jgi:hypothetical protein